MTNLTELWYLLRHAVGEGDSFPKSFAALEVSATNVHLFICPGTGSQVGSPSAVEEWTDLIYVGNQPDMFAPEVALVISPPENYSGAAGCVLFAGGHVRWLPAEQVRLLVKEPWLMATNASADNIETLKKRIDIRLPKRLERYYVTQSGSRGNR